VLGVADFVDHAPDEILGGDEVPEVLIGFGFIRDDDCCDDYLEFSWMFLFTSLFALARFMFWLVLFRCIVAKHIKKFTQSILFS